MAATVESPPHEFTASNDDEHHDHHHHCIVTKRKRTKRPRPSPSFTAVTATTTTTSSSSVTEFHGGESTSHTTATTTTVAASVTYPIVSTESTVSEEEEIVANCLILLAQSCDYSTGSEKMKTHRKVNPAEKSLMIGGESGYVYECQTCNRTFNSFQALGGHRTSHKRPKPTPIDHHHHHNPEPQLEPHNDNLTSDDDHHQHEKLHSKLKLNRIVKLPDAGKLPFVSRKVHECSICGAEFSSGQALGGHMRRHRPLTTALKIAPITSKCDAAQQQGRNMLPLDLNFPAPDDNDHRGDTKFQFAFTSPPPLVDCHF